MRPTDVNGINKAAGEYYHLVYNNVFGVRACSLRLTNVYGPRQLIRHNRQGFIAWFIRLRDRGRRDLRSTATARSSAISSTSTTRPTRSSARAPTTPATARCSTSAARRRISHRDLTALLVDVAGSGRVRVRRVARREEGDRHRQLLRRLVQVQADDRLGAHRRVARRTAANRLVLPPALSAATSTRRAAGARRSRDRALACRSCHSTPEKTRPPFASAIDRVVASGWFVLGPEVEAFEQRVRGGGRRVARGRRRQRHRRADADPARARHRRRATRSSPRRCRRRTRRWR